MLLVQTLVIGLLSATSLAHPGHNVAEEAAERAEFFKRNPKTLSACSSKLKTRGHSSENMVRRHNLANELRARRGLPTKPKLEARDVASYNFTHASTDTSLGLGSHEIALFADNSSCVLQTDVTEGPYYVNGELIRSNITDGQSGVDLTLDIQIIDTSTCKPVPSLYMDIWHANSTGVYSGVVANGNGNSNDTTNLDGTAFRGIQMTDSNGIVQFQTMFPGHYLGRATHIHVLTHNPNSTHRLLNDTLTSGVNASTVYASTVYASHVGQIFFDQSLIAEVDTVEPYLSNEQAITYNADDMILLQEADTTDPFAEYILLGDTIADGLLAWMSIGIDPTESTSVAIAAEYFEGGGVTNEDSSFMGGGSGGAPPAKA